MGATIIGCVIVLIILIVGIFGDKEERRWGIAGVVFTMLFFSIMIWLAWNPKTYEKGQIDALKGNFSYETRYIFRANDTVPIDTIYIKIKN